jgi:hypothetical protein
VGHDRCSGAEGRPGGRAVDLLDPLVDPGIIGGALDERRLGLGALDALLDVVYEQAGHEILVAIEQELRQQVVGVDPGAGDDLQTRRGGQALQSGDVAAEQHRARIDDRPDSVLFDRLGGFEREPILVIVITHVRPLRRDRLVTGEEMLVDQREAEILGIDPSGHRLYRTHGAPLSRAPASAILCQPEPSPWSAGAVAVVKRRARCGGCRARSVVAACATWAPRIRTPAADVEGQRAVVTADRDRC